MSKPDHPTTESYAALRKLAVIGVKKFGVMSPNGLLWQWKIGHLNIRHDEGDGLPTTIIHSRGLLLYRLDDVQDDLDFLARHVILDAIADV